MSKKKKNIKANNSKLVEAFGYLMLTQSLDDKNFKIFKEKISKLPRNIKKPYYNEFSRISQHKDFASLAANLITQFIKDGVDVNHSLPFVKGSFQFKCTPLLFTEIIEKNNILSKLLKDNGANNFINHKDNIVSLIQEITQAIMQNTNPEETIKLIQTFKELISNPVIDIHERLIYMDDEPIQRYIENQVQISSTLYISSQQKSEIASIYKTLKKPLSLFEVIFGTRNPELIEILFKYYKIDFDIKIVMEEYYNAEHVKMIKEIEENKIVLEIYGISFEESTNYKILNENIVERTVSLTNYIKEVLAQGYNTVDIEKSIRAVIEKYNTPRYKEEFKFLTESRPLTEQPEIIFRFLKKLDSKHPIHLLNLNPQLEFSYKDLTSSSINEEYRGGEELVGETGLSPQD